MNNTKMNAKPVVSPKKFPVKILSIGFKTPREEPSKFETSPKKLFRPKAADSKPSIEISTNFNKTYATARHLSDNPKDITLEQERFLNTFISLDKDCLDPK